MSMNLNQIVARVIDAVNTRVIASVQISTGNVTNADGTRTPSYADPVNVAAQVQPLTFRDIMQIQGLNLQGTRKAIYLNGEIDGLIRPTNQGGDLITLPDGSVWLVALVLEGWDLTAGWCKVAATLQNDAPFAGQ
jgi:hypothetical protein